MSLSLNKGSVNWSAAIYVKHPDGKRVKEHVPLGVPVEGLRPRSLRETGDAAFERNRAVAQAAHDKVVAEIRSPVEAMASADRIVAIATGKARKPVSVFELDTIWAAKTRGNGSLPGADTIANYAAYFRHFYRFMRANYPGVHDIRMMDPAMVAEWAEQLRKDGILFNTFNRYVGGLSAAFSAAAVKAGVKSNPFSTITRSNNEEAVAHRKPFTDAEVTRIMDATDIDPEVGPVVVVAGCTCLRRRDCVLLPWSAIDLENGMIWVRANKTGEPCRIPIFARLRKVLEGRKRVGEYVFPELAERFKNKPKSRDWLLDRLKKVLQHAGIDYDKRNDFSSPHPRLRKASQSGWHAFKSTFITLALDTGVSLEMISKVTGNKVADIIVGDYYGPDHVKLSAAMNKAMPAGLTGYVSQAETIKQLVERLTPENAEEIRALLLKGIK